MEINNNLTYKKRFDIVSNLFIQYGTRGRTRTVMISLSVDFESTASTIPPLRREESFLVKPYFKVNQILAEIPVTEGASPV